MVRIIEDNIYKVYGTVLNLQYNLVAVNYSYDMLQLVAFMCFANMIMEYKIYYFFVKFQVSFERSNSVSFTM